VESRDAGKTECFEVSAASLRRTVIQRFGVNQNSTEARYALDCEFTAALGTLTSQPTNIHCNRFVQIDVKEFHMMRF